MSFRERQALDRYITGNYGEDQFKYASEELDTLDELELATEHGFDPGDPQTQREQAEEDLNEDTEEVEEWDEEEVEEEDDWEEFEEEEDE